MANKLLNHTPITLPTVEIIITIFFLHIFGNSIPQRHHIKLLIICEHWVGKPFGVGKAKVFLIGLEPVMPTGAGPVGSLQLLKFLL